MTDYDLDCADIHWALKLCPIRVEIDGLNCKLVRDTHGWILVPDGDDPTVFFRRSDWEAAALMLMGWSEWLQEHCLYYEPAFWPSKPRCPDRLRAEYAVGVECSVFGKAPTFHLAHARAIILHVERQYG